MGLWSDELSNHFIDELSKHRYCVLENALDEAFVCQLRDALRARELRPARVSRQAVSAPTIRNDEIAWIEPANDVERRLFAFFEDLRSTLNRELFLGLTDFEAHFARYDAGHFYAAHVDRFNNNNARVISVVIYLNENWTEEDAGQLKLHLTPPIKVLPRGGTLVAFTSDAIEHEVLPAGRERLSIAAWFRRA